MMILADAPVREKPFVLDLANGIYLTRNRSFASAAEMPGVNIAGGGGIAETPSGALKHFPIGQPRIVPGLGFLREPGAINLLSQQNARPETIKGWALLNNRPSGATITVVDDTASLAAATVNGEPLFLDLLNNQVMNGKVVRLYNPSATSVFTIPVFNTLAGVRYAFSGYVRCVAGSASLQMTAGGGSTPAFSGNVWQRVGRVHAETATTAQCRIVLQPQSTVHCILFCIEQGTLITSPIVVNGGPAIRRDDEFDLIQPQLLREPHTILAEVQISRADFVARQLMTISNPSGAELVVQRHQDNSLSAIQSGVTWRPRLPRVFGPGVIRFAHRVFRRGRTLGFGGVLAHDAVNQPPAALSTITMGAARDGSNPMVGWVRSVEIMPAMNNDDMEALVAPPAGTVPIDVARYVSPNGNDNADGMTPATAWRTLAKAADKTIMPVGVHVFLERGGSWQETLLPVSYCTYRPYGVGAAPKIKGSLFVPGDLTTGFAVDENGSAAWRLQHLHLTQAAQRALNVFGGGGGFVLWRNVVSDISAQTVANGLGLSIRGDNGGAKVNDIVIAENHIYDVRGASAGDAIYCESVGGTVIIEGNYIETPIGHAADCVQVSRSAPEYITDAAHAIIRANHMDMSTVATTSGKGGVVVQALRGDLIDNFIYGVNFCAGIDANFQTVERNILVGAVKNDYSYALAIGGFFTTYGSLWRENVISFCSRAFSFTGQPGYVPPHYDNLVSGNSATDCYAGLRVDRPTTGRFYGNKLTRTVKPFDLLPGVVPPTGGRYPGFTMAFNKVEETMPSMTWAQWLAQLVLP